MVKKQKTSERKNSTRISIWIDSELDELLKTAAKKNKMEWNKSQIIRSGSREMALRLISGIGGGKRSYDLIGRRKNTVFG